MYSSILGCHLLLLPAHVNLGQVRERINQGDVAGIGGAISRSKFLRYPSEWTREVAKGSDEATV
jgi:hypothetical protein